MTAEFGVRAPALTPGSDPGVRVTAAADRG
jgi:hypothetical protein